MILGRLYLPVTRFQLEESLGLRRALGSLAAGGAILAPFLARLAEEMGLAALKILRVPAGLADQRIPTDKPGTVVFTRRLLLSLRPHSFPPFVSVWRRKAKGNDGGHLER